eukprot:TRINITY_DN3572_c0_g1_i2.p1 TRINITY_DN3572_c0_g1~~TRINITY_DN3572_c0_g1_i2.p1  ORF type:complete len:188 (+),score=20.80 TRINITY_DN3572_c0_g1_i2:30-566(+)
MAIALLISLFFVAFVIGEDPNLGTLTIGRSTMGPSRCVVTQFTLFPELEPIPFIEGMGNYVDYITFKVFKNKNNDERLSQFQFGTQSAFKLFPNGHKNVYYRNNFVQGELPTVTDWESRLIIWAYDKPQAGLKLVPVNVFETKESYPPYRVWFTKGDTLPEDYPIIWRLKYRFYAHEV